MICHVVHSLRAFRCPSGGGGSIYVRLVVDHGRILLRVIGLVA